MGCHRQFVSRFRVYAHRPREKGSRVDGRHSDCDPHSCTDADLIDVVGELSNVVSGAFKQRMTASVALDVPDTFGCLVLNLERLTDVAFEDDTGPFWVSCGRLHQIRLMSKGVHDEDSYR